MSETDLSDAEAQELAQTYFDTNVQHSGISNAVFEDLVLTIGRDGPSFQIDVDGTL